jgi:hypothetical protein
MFSLLTETDMEEPATPDRPIKIYTSRAILVSTFLAGPMAGGYMLAENFKAFGERRRATWSLIISILGTALLMTVANLIPFIDKVPPIAFSAAALVVIHQMINYYLAKRMEAHFYAGGKKTGIGKIILVCVIALILTVSLAIVGVFYFTPSSFTSSPNVVTKNYGTLKHEIAYDPGNITVEEVNLIAGALTKGTYFDREIKKTVDVTKEDGRYELFLYCADSVRNNSEVFEIFADLRNDVQKSFPDNKIVINLVVDTQDNVVKRLE